MHLARPDLKFRVLALGPGHGRMERLIVIGLRHPDVILESSGHRTPERMDEPHDGIAVHLRVGNHANRGQVVHLFEGNLLRLHFLVDRVQVLGPAGDIPHQTVFGKLAPHDPDDFQDVLLALFHLLRDSFGERREDVRIKRFEAQIFQFGPHPTDAQPIGERGEKVERLPGRMCARIGRRALAAD